MNERQISYFIAVAEEKNISKASTRVPLSPSALARQIILLEEEMGVELFVRTRSGVRLTPAGELYLQHAYQLRAKLEQIGAAIRAVANSPIRQINIGVVGAGEIGIPYQILAKFSMEYPDIQVILHQIPSRQQQIKALQQGKILAAFNSGFSESFELGVEVVCRERLCAVLNQQHLLATKSAINLTELRGHPMIGPRELQGLPPGIERVFKHHNFEPLITHRTSDLFSFFGMAACGMGIALLPPSLQGLKFPGVVFCPILADFELTVDFECAFLQDEPSSLLVALLDIVRACRATGPDFLS